ncbi:DUF2207 domain-containing protein [Leifsonia sp. H3M29-4]|uniref:DUF2207 family protein n=1 Tax=Salinibacterium metalliresistens TaxID=3031321 RepID=UPI0023DA33FA|nr:DUF2207 domain-containing protein [Salinibacterium metalliresistens]MDF1480077.1 DUF2207 domain-containing protein [Salinibacterium metalliresistens]
MFKPLLAATFALTAVFAGGGAAVAVQPESAPEIVATDVNSFQFESFTADYYLGVDDAGRSTLTTVETFVAVFPDFDQNRGMRRAIPEDYQGEPTDISVLSVTDGEGNPRPYEVESDDEGFLLITSAASDFVHGAQTYVFTYTQRNVTRFFADTNDDEFYWDTNGTGWSQPFGSVTARVHVPNALASALTGDVACYQGYEGSGETCELQRAEEKDGLVFTTSVADVAPYENVTVVLGFAPHTFVERDRSYFGSPFAIPQLLSLGAAIIAAIWAIWLRMTRLADGRGRPTIIAEYTPPKGLDLFTAASILKRTNKGAAAQFVDLAVRKHIRIIETPKTGLFARGTTYLLELIDAKGLEGAPLTLAYALFGFQLQPGTGYLMTGRDTQLSQMVRGIVQSTATATKTEGLRKGASAIGLLPALLVILGGVGSFVFGVIMLDNASGGALPVLPMLLPPIAFIIVFSIVFRSPLTDKGAELRDHFKGLQLYIRLAEADRLRMLQSPTGAERTAVSATDPREVVKVYEKLLPYAILFGLERQWAQELGKYYTEASPDWYSGTGAFNAAVFASSISSLSSSVSTSYSGSSSSSSSGGSGGGGSSGGGGGGGGGGGV